MGSSTIQSRGDREYQYGERSQLAAVRISDIDNSLEVSTSPINPCDHEMLTILFII